MTLIAAIISGPAKGEPQSLYGVPFGYCWVSDRGLFRALLLLDTTITNSQKKVLPTAKGWEFVISN